MQSIYQLEFMIKGIDLTVINLIGELIELFVVFIFVIDFGLIIELLVLRLLNKLIVFN